MILAIYIFNKSILKIIDNQLKELSLDLEFLFNSSINLNFQEFILKSANPACLFSLGLRS